MAHRSQCSSAGDNPLDPNYLPPHYREEYRLAIDALVEEDLDGYYQFLQKADVVDFLSSSEIQYIQESHQVPQQSNNPEYSLETGGDGSSDTYWPIHSDLDAPGLDLGWPQLHHFIGPTEVTTLVNPPEPEMPSIKDQARRLIKTAQQVIAIAMDMFTDVDIFHDVLTAAMRNVAVYILLDENNAHHFVNMVSNCRVNLQSIQFLRVRTVSGITYHCRSGKSFKGQMMDRFLLTDCRAVLSGNYSFMWSFEKLHRCMAHLFLGQLVSTFDEEFRILFAQSQPLLVEDMLAPVEDFSLLQKRQYLSERTSLYREPRKFLSLDTAHPEEWPRHSYDERLDMDWRMMPLKRKETLHGPADMYSRFPSQQSRMDPSFDQGPSRMPLMENPYFKRHSYAEGIHGRHSYPFLPQQGMPEPENQGRQFHRWQQPYPVPGKEADNSSYDKFWNKDYLLADQYSEPGLPPEIEPPDNFDPVVNYLSSTGNVDFDQSSDKVLPAADLPFSSSFPRRLSLGQPYACETSPTPSNPTDQKQFFLEPNTDRKDPMVKRGLRDWRISSYLSTYENKEDEGLPLAPPNMPDPFEEPSNVIQQTTTVTPGIDLVVPKIPNVREFKVPAIPRASQMPSYIKITPREQPKNLPDEPTVHQASVTAETKTTPATSESSTTTEGEKTEEAEQKEPKPSVFQREDSFRRKYNAGLQRSSRLRSSLIFGSLEQQNTAQDTKTIPGQQDEESEKNESERTKPPFLSQGLGQRRSMAREPFEWSRYIKSATFDNSTTDPSKPDDGNSKAEDKCPSKDENSKNLSGKCEVQEILKPPNVEQRNSSPSVPQSKPSEVELTKAVQPMKPPKSLLTTPMFVDMNDADMRLMFFKELAAKRKAAIAAQAEKSKEKAQMKTPTEKKCTTIKKEEPGPQQTVESMGDTTTSEGLSEKNSIAEEAEKTSSTEACKSVSLSLEASDETVSQDGQVENDPNTNQSCEEAKTRFATDSEMIKLKNNQPAANLPVSAESETPQSESQEQPKLSRSTVEDRSPSHPPTTENATHENAPLAQGTDEDENPLIDSTSNESSLLVPRSEEVPPSAASDSNTPNPESMNLVTSIFYPPPSSEQHPESEFSSSRQSVKSASSNESSLLVPSSEEVPPSAASDSNTQSPESMNLVTSSSYPPPSSEQHPESEFSSSRQSVKSASSNESSLLVPSSEDVPPSEFAASDSNTQSPESVNLVTSSSCPPPSSEQHPESEFNTSNQSIESASSHLIVPDLGSQISPKPSPSCSVPIPTKAETVSSEVILEDSSSTLTSTILSTNEQETVSPSAQSVQETVEKPTAPVSQTESECTQPHSDSVSQSMSSETLSAVGPAHEESDISQDTCDAVSEPITSSLRSTAKTESSAHSEQYVPGSENSSVPQASGEESEALGSSETVKADSMPPNPIHQSPESCLPDVADLESKPRSDQNEVIPTSSAADHPSETSVGETNSLVHPDSTTHPSQSETITSLQESPRQETAPSELQLTGPVTPSSVEIESCSPLAESVGSVLSHEAKQTLSALHTHPNTDSLPEQVTTDSNKTPVLQSTETCSPTEPTSKVPREPESVTSESQPSEPAVPAENGNMNRQNEVSQEAEMPDTDEKKTDDTEVTDKVNKTTFKESPCSEKTNDQVRQNNCPEQPEISSDEVIPTTPQTKQPKSSQSRYHSSTANVLSSSNLRDDTKLLLEQISANSQSRNDAAKESPVTDDEKEGEADKNAKREKERGMRYLSRGQAKSNQEREMLLERIQSMRKERKVYSRFEMAP